MSVNEFSSSLYDELETKLTEINTSTNNILRHTGESLSLTLQFISRLKEFVTRNEFTNKDEEVIFFKIIKPQFISKLIYYQKVYAIQSRLNADTITDLKDYYLKELRKLRAWFHDNIEFLIYYRSGAQFLDEAYFIRKEPDSWLLLNFEDYETDLSFTTIYDHKVSKILAFEMLSAFLKGSLEKLEMQFPVVTAQSSENGTAIIWTASKASLVELVYALQSVGAFNNGHTDLKQLATHLESFFKIDLGNYYRTFQEIRIRKSSRSAFLDQLKDKLLQRMDESDENPKF